MSRKSSSFLAIAERLDKELDVSYELFFKQRAFLEDPTKSREIISLSEEDIERKVDNIIAIEQMSKKIKELAYER